MTTKASPPLTSLSEAQRTQALERFALLRPALEGQIPQTQLAREQQIPLSTIQRWIKQYREKGLAGLANTSRSDKGKSRRLSTEAVTLIEGLALQTILGQDILDIFLLSTLADAYSCPVKLTFSLFSHSDRSESPRFPARQPLTRCNEANLHGIVEENAAVR